MLMPSACRMLPLLASLDPNPAASHWDSNTPLPTINAAGGVRARHPARPAGVVRQRRGAPVLGGGFVGQGRRGGAGWGHQRTAGTCGALRRLPCSLLRLPRGRRPPATCPTLSLAACNTRTIRGFPCPHPCRAWAACSSLWREPGGGGTWAVAGPPPLRRKSTVSLSRRSCVAFFVLCLLIVCLLLPCIAAAYLLRAALRG